MRRAPPPKRIRTTFGPLNEGFVSMESFTSGSAADNVPPVASRPLQAATLFRKVRRGRAGPPLGVDSKDSVISGPFTHLQYSVCGAFVTTKCALAACRRIFQMTPKLAASAGV